MLNSKMYHRIGLETVPICQAFVLFVMFNVRRCTIYEGVPGVTPDLPPVYYTKLDIEYLRCIAN